MAHSAAFSLDRYADQARAEVDAALLDYTDLGRDCPDTLREAIRYSLLSPGKRLRPLLVLLAAEACGGERQTALPAACAVEMIHAYSLIHDDLPAMDNDDLRRGRPTCHKAFGEGVAILAGDALQALAFQVLAEEIDPPDVASRCCAELAVAAGATRLVGGQADDLAGESYTGSLERLESIHARKTGALFLASAQLGALVAQADAWQRTAVEEYARRLGLLFQITDDLLDVHASTTQLGKRTGKDLDAGKLTFPGVVGVEESRRRALALAEEARAALGPLGGAAAGLDALARNVLERTH
jgi:geranylgeranyl diphosphate synthase type II